MCKYYCLYLLTVYGLAAGAAQISQGGCVLPDYPAHGTYTVYRRPDASPGQTYDSAGLTVTCDSGYRVVGSNNTSCYGGNVWQQPIPTCVRFCRLTPDPSVKYRCRVTGENELNGTRLCNELEPHGTVVVPECNRPFYYSSSLLLNMHCVNGTWDHVAVCQPDCGTPTPIANELITNGTRAKHGELPWHAGIYDKTYTPFRQICGGSLVSKNLVISAAHCFWRAGKGQQPPSTYAVALGKIYRPWDDAMDEAHKSDISEIKIPLRYLGVAGHYQEDIALVFMSTPVVYRTYIRPVCIDFGVEFDKIQLQNSNSGKISGWGLASEDGAASPVLLTTELPYLDDDTCFAGLPENFKSYLTSDKFCAGDKNVTTVCQGDSGGGLVFPSEERGIRRYYLRGVVSTAPPSEHKCNVNSYVIFTRIQFHATLIKDGLGVASTEGNVTTEYIRVPDHDDLKDRVAADGCPLMTPGRTTEPTGIKSWDKCLEYQMQLLYPCKENYFTKVKVRHDLCRHQTDKMTAGISGTIAKADEFTHMVLLDYGENITSGLWTCGGTLISDRFILTSVRCCANVKYAKVGFFERKDDEEPWQVRRIIRIIRHPDYNLSTKHNDIALLGTVPFHLGPTAVPACLDVFGGDHNRAGMAMWAGLYFRNQKTWLRKVMMTKLTDIECSDLYPVNSHGATFNSTIQVCYGDNDNDFPSSCLADGGEPLTILNHRLHCMYTVVGINSFGVGCGNRGAPTWYTKVAHYVPWIESIVWP